MSAYGVPYMAPLAPFTLKGMRDYLVRLTWYKIAKDDVGLNDLKGVSK
jgi:hypothetical protein